MYTQEMFNLADRLVRDTQYRDALIEALRNVAKPITYSNQDFDHKQTLADFLTPARTIQEGRY